MPAEARLHRLAQIAGIFQPVGGLAERWVHLPGSEPAELATICFRRRVVGDLRRDFGEIRAGHEPRAHLLRQRQRGCIVSLGRVEQDMRSADLFGGFVLLLVQRIDFARLGQKIDLPRVELGGRVALDLAHHRYREHAVGLEREPTRNLRIAIEPGVACLLGQLLVDQQRVEEHREPRGVRGELGTHLRGYPHQKVSHVVGTGELHERVLGKDLVLGFERLREAIGADDERGQCQCSGDALQRTWVRGCGDESNANVHDSFSGRRCPSSGKPRWGGAFRVKLNRPRLGADGLGQSDLHVAQALAALLRAGRRRGRKVGQVQVIRRVRLQHREAVQRRLRLRR